MHMLVERPDILQLLVDEVDNAHLLLLSTC